LREDVTVDGLPTDDLKERVLRYFRLVDEGRIEEMLALFGEGIVYRRTGVDPIVGLPAMRAFYEGPRGIVTIRHDIVALVREGDCVAIEGRARATLTDGGSFDRRIGEFFRFRDDLIVERNGYDDVAG
jgi:ketosteroid isomerase-like protein